MSDELSKLLDETTKSLVRVQQFDAGSLIRKEVLGSQNFEEAVEPAEKVIQLYQRLNASALQDFPVDALNRIKSGADEVFNIFQQALKYDLAKDDRAQRSSVIEELQRSYSSHFERLHPFISYSLHRSADFANLDRKARATVQAVQDRTDAILVELEKTRAEAEAALETIRSVAAEQGIDKQGNFFKLEADGHTTDATTWRNATIWMACAVGALAIASLFLHKIPFFAPTSAYDTIQLAISKILVVGVAGYMLVFSARNFMGHKHNKVVNNHRLNALKTHRAIVEGGADPVTRDAIMLQASSCIFSPQATGYVNQRGDSDTAGSRHVVEIMAKSAASTAAS